MDRAGKHIVIAIPAYSGTVHVGTMRAIISDMLLLMKAGNLVTLIDDCGNAEIADSRARIAKQFLESSGDVLFLVDHDVVWPVGALKKLVEYHVDCVAAVYPQRKDPIEFSLRFIREREELWGDPETGLLEVDAVPSGFLCLSRAMLEQMTEAYRAELECHRGDEKKSHVALFDPYREGKMKLSEDYAFCKRWRDIGGKVWVDPEIRMAHIGNKSFEGHLGDMLRSRTGEAI